MLVHLLKKHIPQEKESEVFTLLQLLGSTNQRAIDIINAFVNQEFLESVEVKLLKRRVDLGHKIQEVFNQFKANEHYLKKNFILEQPPGDFYVEVDEMNFMQVINNLISNSLKFTKEDGEIEISLKQQNSHIIITVADNWVGIPEEYGPYLFDKFTKARRIGQKGEKPMGLGMSIIKAIVELHEGEIWFESKEGKVTVFYIRLPK